MDDQKDRKAQWFGPKRDGFGLRPTSWQGWLILGVGVLLEIAIINFAHDTYPTWFVAKTSGTGFNPSTWQGWLACAAPIAIFVLLIRYISNKQRGD